MKRPIIGIFSAIFALNAVSGCTLGDFKEPASQTGPVAINRPYQEVFRSIRDFAKSCYEMENIGSAMKVDAQLYSDLKRGEIRIYLIGGPVRQNHLAIDIQARSADTTDVTVSLGFRPVVSSPSSIEKFFMAARGIVPRCGL